MLSMLSGQFNTHNGRSGYSVALDTVDNFILVYSSSVGRLKCNQQELHQQEFSPFFDSRSTVNK